MRRPDIDRPALFGRREAEGRKEDRTEQWIEERTAVLRALEGYPDARAEVMRELEAMCRRLES